MQDEHKTTIKPIKGIWDWPSTICVATRRAQDSVKSSRRGARQEPRSLQPLLGTAGVEPGAARCQGVLGDHVVSALIVQVRPTEPKERRDFA